MPFLVTKDSFVSYGGTPKLNANSEHVVLGHSLASANPGRWSPHQVTNDINECLSWRGGVSGPSKLTFALFRAHQSFNALHARKPVHCHRNLEDI